MNHIIPILLLLLSSCSAVVPDTIFIHNSPYEYELVVESVEDFASAYKNVFEEDVHTYLSDVDITFEVKTPEEWNTVGCIRGQTNPYTYQDIQVATQGPRFPIQSTALWHELNHIVLYWTTGRPGYGHGLDGEGPWTEQHDILIRDLRTMYNERTTDNDLL